MFRVCTLIWTISLNLFKDTLCRYVNPTNLCFEEYHQKGTNKHNDEGHRLELKDAELLFCYNYLRNNCGVPQHKNGWGSPPDSDDNSLAACIDSIMIQRNAIVRYMKSGISDLAFQHILYKLRDDIIEIEQQVIGGNEYKERVDVFLATSINQLIAANCVGKRTCSLLDDKSRIKDIVLLSYSVKSSGTNHSKV